MKCLFYGDPSVRDGARLRSHLCLSSAQKHEGTPACQGPGSQPQETYSLVKIRNTKQRVRQRTASEPSTVTPNALPWHGEK